MAGPFPLRFQYAMTRWGRVQHWVWVDGHGKPAVVTVCGRRWSFLSDERDERYPLCGDCQAGKP